MAYDKAGNITAETDAEGAKQTYAYDAVGRMTAVTDALGAVTRYAYDKADNLTKVTDANGHATTYAYEKGGNLVSETDALGNTVRYAYTPEGWLDTITKADGVTVSYEYDKTGNITKETASDGTVTNHEYNQIGKLVTTESDEGVTKYKYNRKGYLAYVVNPGGEVVSYTYDDYGRKVALKYPDGKVVSYTYDEMDRMTGVTGLDGDTTTYTYDAAGRRTGTKNSTLTTTYAYDAVGNLTKQETNGKTEISFEYVYNLNNAITGETRVENGASVKSAYTYDALGQLTSFVKSDGHSETYAYDKTGNMLEKVLNSTKISMTYDAANELKTMTSVGGKIDYTYDANGNLTAKTLGTKTDTYTYDSYNQLTSYKGYDGYQQRDTYNAQGHMIRKESKGNANRQTLEEIVRGDEAKQAASDGGDGDDDPDPYADKSASDSWQVTSYIYDVTAPYYEVLAETTDGKTTTYDYGVERIAAYSGGAWNAQKTEYVYDGRGSVAQEVSYNNSWYTFGGKIGKASIGSKSYTPFGEQLGVAMSGYGFNGQYYDSATGMLNLRARQYEPTQMRFNGRDLLRGDMSVPLSLNRYLYCTNDPVNFADFSGQSLKSLWNKAKSAVSSAAKSVAKAVTSAAKAVAKAVTNTAARVVSAVVTAAKNTVSVAKAIYNTTKTVVNTAKAVSNAARSGDTARSIGAIVSGAAQTYNNYVEARSEIEAANESNARFMENMREDPGYALAVFAAESFGDLSREKQKILDTAVARMRELQLIGASEIEIAQEFLKACRAVGEHAVETSVEEIKNDIVKPTYEAAVPQPIREDISNFDLKNQSEQVALDANYVSAYKGKLVVKLPIDTDAFSIGAIFLGDNVGSRPDSISTVQHEYGHTKQFEKMGMVDYLTDVAVPSVAANLLDRAKLLPYDYYNSPWEYEADKQGGVQRVDKAGISVYESWAESANDIYNAVTTVGSTFTPW